MNGGVCFVYLSDDMLDILKDVIVEFSCQLVYCFEFNYVVILVYFLVFYEIEMVCEEFCIFVIMDKFLCFCIEDYVNYLLLLFVMGFFENL